MLITLFMYLVFRFIFVCFGYIVLFDLTGIGIGIRNEAKQSRARQRVWVSLLHFVCILGVNRIRRKSVLFFFIVLNLSHFETHLDLVSISNSPTTIHATLRWYRFGLLFMLN